MSFSKNLSQKRTLGLIGLLIIFLGIPLTVYLAQRQQEIRQRAAAKSKLSIQTSWQKPGTMEFIETAKPVVVKLLDGYDRAGEIKQKSSGTFVIARKWEQNQPFDGEPETKAQEWFDRNRGILGMDNIDCWEGYNEPDVSSDDAVRWISRFEVKRMQLLESIGKKACIGNFSVGNPDYPRWQYFRDAMSYASSHGHYLGIHEYGPTSMSDRSDDYSLRHRRVYRDNGFSTPLIITETGIDENGNPDTGGWRAHTNAGDYFNQLKWYDDRLQEDSYVKGATIFSYGLYDWNSFEIYPELVGSDGRSGPLTAYIGGGVAPTSGPTPTPQPCSVSWTLSSSTPVPGTNITAAIRGVSDPGEWQNIGLTKDGSTIGITSDGIGNPWPTFNYTVNSGTSGTHTLRFTVNNGSRECTPTRTFTTSGPTPTPGASNTRLYIDPSQINPGGSVTTIATGTTSCSTNISTSFGAGLSCGNPNVLTCSQPNPKNDGNPCWWRWACSAGSIAGSYTATFNASGTNCASSRNYSVVSPTPTPRPTNTPTPTPTRTPTPTPNPLMRADVDRNGCVGVVDFNLWLRTFTQGTILPGTYPDINQDGTVNLLDFNFWFNAMQRLSREFLCH